MRESKDPRPIARTLEDLPVKAEQAACVKGGDGVTADPSDAKIQKKWLPAN